MYVLGIFIYFCYFSYFPLLCVSVYEFVITYIVNIGKFPTIFYVVVVVDTGSMA